MDYSVESGYARGSNRVRRTCFVSPGHHAGKQVERSAAQGVQDVKHSLHFCTHVTSFIEESKMISKSHIVAMAIETQRIMTATQESTDEMLGAIRCSKQGI